MRFILVEWLSGLSDTKKQTNKKILQRKNKKNKLEIQKWRKETAALTLFVPNLTSFKKLNTLNYSRKSHSYFFKPYINKKFQHTGEMLPTSYLSWCNVTVRPIAAKYILSHNDKAQSFISFAVWHLAGHRKRHGFDLSKALPSWKSAVFVFMGNINVVAIHLCYMGIFPIHVPRDA